MYKVICADENCYEAIRNFPSVEPGVRSEGIYVLNNDSKIENLALSSLEKHEMDTNTVNEALSDAIVEVLSIEYKEINRDQVIALFVYYNLDWREYFKGRFREFVEKTRSHSIYKVNDFVDGRINAIHQETLIRKLKEEHERRQKMVQFYLRYCKEDKTNE